MFSVKRKLPRAYFLDIFSEPSKICSKINSGIAQFLTKRPKNNRPRVSFYKD